MSRVREASSIVYVSPYRIFHRGFLPDSGKSRVLATEIDGGGGGRDTTDSDLTSGRIFFSSRRLYVLSQSAEIKWPRKKTRKTARESVRSRLIVSPSSRASQISVFSQSREIQRERDRKHVDAKRRHHLTNLSIPLETLGTRELVNVKYRIHFAGDSTGSSLWQPCSPLGHSFSSIFRFFFSPPHV